MLKPTDRLRNNELQVAAKVIDGEAILINLVNGTYYSLDPVGAAAWLLLDSGCSIVETSARLGKVFDAEAGRVEADVAYLAERLLAEGLVLLDPDRGPARESVDLGWAGGRAYERPLLQMYTDMGDVLALDPPLPALYNEPAPGADPGRFAR